MAKEDHSVCDALLNGYIHSIRSPTCFLSSDMYILWKALVSHGLACNCHWYHVILSLEILASKLCLLCFYSLVVDVCQQKMIVLFCIDIWDMRLPDNVSLRPLIFFQRLWSSLVIFLLVFPNIHYHASHLFSALSHTTEHKLHLV